MRDAEDKRRGYLDTKRLLNTLAMILAYVTLGVAPAILICAAADLYWMASEGRGGSIADRPTILFFTALAVGSVSARLWRHFARESEQLAYVPPVEEQIAALPVEEVLVRGADGPEATSSELLRPARSDPNPEGAELLRADRADSQ